MKVIIAVLALIAIAFASSDEALFRKFMVDYQKVYSAKEFQIRYKNFQNTLRRIDGLNNMEGQQATFGINEFADLSVQEFKSTYLMNSFDASDICIWPWRAGVGADTSALPPTFDWRTKGVVTPIKNQGGCGSCWAFSTTGNLEGQWALWSKSKALTGLSEQWLVDCSNSCLVSEPQLCNGGCGGGLPWLAYQDIQKKKGIDSEAAYPYQGEQGPCQASEHASVATVSNWTAVSSDPTEIMTFLVSQGPLSITLNAGLLMSYTSGIITGSPSSCPVSEMDHAVLLVGFDTTASTPNWIVKNSWGTSWGNEGYFQIAYAQGLCGINACVTSSLLN